MDIKKRNVRGPYSSGCSWVVMKSPSSVVVIRDEIHVSLANNTQPDPNNMLSWRDIGEYRANVLFIIYFSLAFLIFSFPFPIFFFPFFSLFPPLWIHFSDGSGESLRLFEREREREREMDTIQCWPPRQVHYSKRNTYWNQSAQKPSFTHPSTDLDYIDMEISTPPSTPPLFIHPLESIL